MLRIGASQEQLGKRLGMFVWTFKIGDNILYNLDVIFKLVKDHNRKDGHSYTKPISILCVSVIEAVLVDFLERLDQGTSHFPDKLNAVRVEVKNELEKEKKYDLSVFNGQAYKNKKLRNFGYKELIEFYKKFRLIGLKDSNYQILQRLGHFRNRVHIRNYFENFERDEVRVFSEARTQETINIMEEILRYFSEKYARP